jgi:hypothetical protein
MFQVAPLQTSGKVARALEIDQGPYDSVEEERPSAGGDRDRSQFRGGSQQRGDTAAETHEA